MTLTTPTKNTIEVCDSIRDLSALRYLRFNQAWARENGLGTDIYDADSHLVRLSAFLAAGEVGAARGELNNLLLGLQNLGGADPAFPARPQTQHLQIATLAPLVLAIAGQPRTDLSESGLRATHDALLAAGLPQQELSNALASVKKNFRPS